MFRKLKFSKDLRYISFQTPGLKVMEQITHLILVNSSTSSLLQPWVQPENANMSISYLRWSTRNGPFCFRRLITFLPNSSIWGVNLRALKLTRQRSFWISKDCPLFANRASVRFKWTTLYFCINGRIWENNHTICLWISKKHNWGHGSYWQKIKIKITWFL